MSFNNPEFMMQNWSNGTEFAGQGFHAGSGAFLPALIAMGIIFIFLFALIMLAVYVYYGFAYMSLAKKLKQKSPGLAWIPFVGPLIIEFKASKMHWWPWLLLIGFMIPFIGMIAMIIFCIFSIIWLWKMFEAVKRPGWWALLSLISPLKLIFVGIAAWTKK